VKGHINVDLLIEKFSPKLRAAINICTRLIGIGFFFVSGLYLIRMGTNLRNAQEVSLTLELPFYPLCWGIGFSFFIVCLVMMADVGILLGGKNE